MDSKISEYDCESGEWCLYLQTVEEHFDESGLVGDYRLPALLCAMGPEAYEMLIDLASPRRICNLRYDEVVAIMQENLQAPPTKRRREYRDEDISWPVSDDDEQASSGAAVNDETELEEQLEAVHITAPEPDKTDEDAGQAAASAVASESKQPSGSDYFCTESDIRVPRPCTRCGRVDHDKVACRHGGAVCNYCLLTGHLRRVCPDRVARRPQLPNLGTAERRHWM